MRLTLHMDNAELERAIYEYLVRRGYPAALKVTMENHAPTFSLVHTPCKDCENRTVIEGIGNREMDCACVKGGTDA